MNSRVGCLSILGFLACVSLPSWAGPNVVVGYQPISGACADQAEAIVKAMGRFSAISRTSRGNVLAENYNQTVFIMCEYPRLAIITSAGDNPNDNSNTVQALRSAIK